MLRALALTLILTGPAHAQDLISGTLLPGWTTERGTRMAAVRLTLAPGWKTYWRSPGEAGIPPVFDWEGSGNVVRVSPHWPTPQVFHQNGLETLGYSREVVLPLELHPRQPGAPMDVALHVRLGVCSSDVCVPAELSLSGRLDGETADPGIRAALADRPLTAGEAGVGRVACEVEPIADGLRVTAHVALPGLRGDEAVVMETADPSVWVSGSDVRADGGTVVATADMVPPNGAPFALDRSALRLTVVGDRGAVEIIGCPAP